MYCCKDENLQFKEHFGSSWSELVPTRLAAMSAASIAWPYFFVFGALGLFAYATVWTTPDLAIVVAGLVAAAAVCLAFARQQADTPRVIWTRNEKQLHLGLLFILHERLKRGELIAYEDPGEKKNGTHSVVDKRYWSATFGWLGLLGSEVPFYANQSRRLRPIRRALFVKWSDINVDPFFRERLLITGAFRPSALVTWTKCERETLLAFISELRASDRRLARGFLYLEEYCGELANGRTREQSLATVCKTHPKGRQNIRNSTPDQIVRGVNLAFNNRLKKGILALIDRNI
jgi:hypothetical protein